MRKSIHKLHSLTLAFIMTLMIAGCMSDPENSTTQSFSGVSFTVTGSYPDYKLITDDGIVMYPTAASVAELTDGKGFGSHKRVQFSGNFESVNMSVEGNVQVFRKVTLTKYYYIPEITPVTESEAISANITDADSISGISAIYNIWVANGYITTTYYAYKSFDSKGNEIEPTANVLVSDLGNNSVTLTMLFNQHHTKDCTTSSSVFGFISSFDIGRLYIQGTDSVSVTFQGKGITTSTTKVPRSAFEYAR